MTAVKFLSKLRLEMSIEQQNNKTMTSCSWWLLLPIVRFYSLFSIMLLLHITVTVLPNYPAFSPWGWNVRRSRRRPSRGGAGELHSYQLLTQFSAICQVQYETADNNKYFHNL